MSVDRRSLLAGLSLFVSVGTARASLTAPDPLSPEDQHAVDAVIGYLHGLTTASGRFVQTDARGGRTEGAFYLQRPGRARFDYDPPSGLVIASDGHTVSVVNRRLKTIQSYPLGLTPLGLFLSRDIRLDRGVSVTQVTHNLSGLTIVARDARKANKGQIALTFTEDPIGLIGWRLTDARGGVVEVRLASFGPSEPHDPGFFRLADPREATTPAVR